MRVIVNRTRITPGGGGFSKFFIWKKKFEFNDTRLNIQEKRLLF